jgi:anaerobic ribonucleoside-triphosphate reductase activating protein
MIKKIRLAGIAPQSTVNGVGLRKVYFSQGCSHHCKGCFNPETWSFKGGKLFDIDQLVKEVAQEKYLDGVTLSGGDPFQQVKPFVILAEKLKRKKINIWCFTGYQWEYLLKKSQTNTFIKRLLECIDVLVDGRYEKRFHSENHPYRGSSNQRLIDVKNSLKNKRTIIFEIKN